MEKNINSIKRKITRNYVKLLVIKYEMNNNTITNNTLVKMEGAGHSSIKFQQNKQSKKLDSMESILEELETDKDKMLAELIKTNRKQKKEIKKLQAIIKRISKDEDSEHKILDLIEENYDQERKISVLTAKLKKAQEETQKPSYCSLI